MSCLEFLGCLLQFMEYLSREKNTEGCRRRRWEVCIYAHSLSFCLWHKPIRAHMLRRTRKPTNGVQLVILCLSPETSLLVSHTWEHPLGRLCSDTWFDACFLLPTVSAGALELSHGTALAPSSQTCCQSQQQPRRALVQASGSLCWLCPNTQVRAELWIPWDHIHIFPEPSFKSGSRLCLRYGIDL